MPVTRRQPATDWRPTTRIGGPLRALLDARFITHEEFAHAVGASVSTVGRWCRSETMPSKRRMRQIASYLEVEPTMLIERPDDEAPDDEVAA